MKNFKYSEMLNQHIYNKFVCEVDCDIEQIITHQCCHSEYVWENIFLPTHNMSKRLSDAIENKFFNDYLDSKDYDWKNQDNL
jgi:hypothetical protein